MKLKIFAAACVLLTAVIAAAAGGAVRQHRGGPPPFGPGPDPERMLPGRGAWLHPDLECFALATARRGFDRALRAPMTIPKETVDFTRTWPRNASTS